MQNTQTIDIDIPSIRAEMGLRRDRLWRIAFIDQRKAGNPPWGTVRGLPLAGEALITDGIHLVIQTTTGLREVVLANFTLHRRVSPTKSKKPTIPQSQQSQQRKSRTPHKISASDMWDFLTS